MERPDESKHHVTGSVRVWPIRRYPRAGSNTRPTPPSVAHLRTAHCYCFSSSPCPRPRRCPSCPWRYPSSPPRPPLPPPPGPCSSVTETPLPRAGPAASAAARAPNRLATILTVWFPCLP